MSTRATTLSVALGLLLAAGFVGLFVWAEHRDAEEVRRQADSSARQAAYRLHDYARARLLIVQAISVERRVGLLADREKFERRVAIAQQELGGYRAINWIAASGEILWVSPRQGNEAAIGRNVFEHSYAAPFARHAELTMEPTITGPLDLFQGARGFTSYFPVVEGGEVRGYVNGVFNCTALVEASLREGILSDYEIRVQDAGELVYESEAFATTAPAPGVGTSERRNGRAELSLMGRTWMVDLAPNDALLAAHPGVSNKAGLMVGLCLIVFLVLVLRAVLLRRALAHRLEEERQKLAGLVETSHDFHAMATPSGEVFYFNRVARQMLGLSDETPLQGRFSDFVRLDDRPRLARALAELQRLGRWVGELELISSSESEGAPLDIEAGVLCDAFGTPTALTFSGRDLRERRALETQLLHAQKMEAIGRLAGGVAHDFNNLLTAVLGHASMAALEEGLSDVVREDLTGIVDAARRGSDLTKNLLAFSRRPVVAPRSVDLSEQIEALAPLLRRLVRENVKMTLDIPASVETVAIDPSQLEHMLMNLVVNAVDAMPDGGHLTIALRPSLVAGEPWSVLTVRDDGVGMSEDTKARAFEPFFTTKGEGEGTGLGLASVYGSVEQAGGHVVLESALGLGTSFEIWLPRTGARVVSARPPAALAQGEGHLLLVEDEVHVRRSAARSLRRVGFVVTDAADGEEALEKVAAGLRFDVLVSDVIMPGMSGPELATELRRQRPGLAVVLCSGYARDELDTNVLDELDAIFVPKPYTPAELTAAIATRRQEDRQEQDVG